MREQARDQAIDELYKALVKQHEINTTLLTVMSQSASKESELDKEENEEPIDYGLPGSCWNNKFSKIESVRHRPPLVTLNRWWI